MQDLETFLTDDPPQGWQEPESVDLDLPERFRIQDDNAANWAMRKLRQAERRKADNARMANDEIQRINEWLQRANQPYDRDVAYFTGLLTEYARDCRLNPEDGRKTIALPAGVVSSRNNQPKWSVDPEVFLPWAHANAPDLIRVKEEPDLSAIKSRFKNLADGTTITDDGEVVVGVVVSESETSYTVKPNLD